MSSEDIDHSEEYLTIKGVFDPLNCAMRFYGSETNLYTLVPIHGTEAITLNNCMIWYSRVADCCHAICSTVI